jgi:hypothetical protein
MSNVEHLEYHVQGEALLLLLLLTCSVEHST